jgi:general secretion pathway protein I
MSDLARFAICAAGGSLHRPQVACSMNSRMLDRFRGLEANERDDSGFTLVEVIVALAMLSIGLTVLLGQISGGLRQAANAERMAEAASLTQSLVAEVGADLPIGAEERDGHFPNGYRWHLRMHPYGDAKEQEEWPVGLYTISAEVEWGEGEQRRSFGLTTLRVGPRQVHQ